MVLKCQQQKTFCPDLNFVPTEALISAINLRTLEFFKEHWKILLIEDGADYTLQGGEFGKFEICL